MFAESFNKHHYACGITYCLYYHLDTKYENITIGMIDGLIIHYPFLKTKYKKECKHIIHCLQSGKTHLVNMNDSFSKAVKNSAKQLIEKNKYLIFTRLDFKIVSFQNDIVIFSIGKDNQLFTFELTNWSKLLQYLLFHSDNLFLNFFYEDQNIYNKNVIKAIQKFQTLDITLDITE